MPLFIMFVFASIVFGSGLLLSPALGTAQPRIGLGAAVVLALITVAAVGYTRLVGWDTLIIDYVCFGLLVGVFLTGTFSMGMFKAEIEGKRETGWPGPRELVFFAGIVVIFALFALGSPPRMGLRLHELAGQSALLQAQTVTVPTAVPGFVVLTAYFAKALSAPIVNVQLALGAVLSVIFVWLAYDFGNEWYDDGTRGKGIAFALVAALGAGALNFPPHYDALLMLVFVFGALLFGVHLARRRPIQRVTVGGAAALTIGALLSTGDLTLIVRFGLVIAFAIGGGIGLLWLRGRIGSDRVDRWVKQAGLPLLGGAAIVIAFILTRS